MSVYSGTIELLKVNHKQNVIQYFIYNTSFDIFWLKVSSKLSNKFNLNVWREEYSVTTVIVSDQVSQVCKGFK